MEYFNKSQIRNIRKEKEGTIFYISREQVVSLFDKIDKLKNKIKVLTRNK